MITVQLLKALLIQFAGEAAKDRLDEKLTKAAPRVVAGMTGKGVTLDKVDLNTACRDALFRLIRSVVPSGDISDFIRDHMEEKIKPCVALRQKASTDLLLMVGHTKDCLLEQLF